MVLLVQESDLPLAVQAQESPRLHKATRPKFAQTLCETVVFNGHGVHSGAPCTLKLHPAASNHGLKFLRSDLSNGARLIETTALGVSHSKLCTTLSNAQGGSIATIEHLMAALHVLGLTNVLIEIDGPEIPILDGSSRVFIEEILAHGIAPQTQAQTYISVTKHVSVHDGLASASIGPASDKTSKDLTASFSINFAAACIGAQSREFSLADGDFANQIAPARTFGFANQIAELQAQGLALGGSMDNAIYIYDGAVANPDGLRFHDEFVRHKLLDAVGDLFIEGLPLIGHYQGVRAGHALTNALMRTLMADKSAFEYVTI